MIARLALGAAIVVVVATLAPHPMAIKVLVIGTAVLGAAVAVAWMRRA